MTIRYEDFQLTIDPCLIAGLIIALTICVLGFYVYSILKENS